MLYFIVFILILAIIFLASAIRILKEYERGVIFRLGRVIKAKGPGLIILIPVVDRMVKVSLAGHGYRRTSHSTPTPIPADLA